MRDLRELECEVRRVVEIALIGMKRTDTESHVRIYAVFNYVLIGLCTSTLVSFND